jgi:hypothetical protein
VHVPVHPSAWRNRRLRRIFRPLADFNGVFFGNQSTLKKYLDFLLKFFAAAVLSVAQFSRQPFAHLFAHEHGVGADVNDPSLREQSIYQRFDVWIDQRLPSAD